MTFYYQNAPKPKGSVIGDLMEKACERLLKKLSDLDLQKLDISDYNKTYFGSKIRTHQDIFFNLLRYSYHLTYAIGDYKKPLSEFVFIDHGGGHGMMSLLAKELGIGTVIHTDIYDVSCKDAQVIGRAISAEANYYIPGELDDLKEFINSKNLHIDGMASFDVIEHIYDMPGFLRELGDLSSAPFRIFLGSGANIMNPMKRKNLRPRQLLLENDEREAVFGLKKRDTTRSYKSLREEYIKENYGDKLDQNQLKELTLRTRGQNYEDISKTVDLYLETNVLPDYPDHPTNTCDPRNGNWAEHLMDPYELTAVLEEVGFKAEVLPGYYGNPASPLKKPISWTVNFTIAALGKKKGLYISPFFNLLGVKK